MASRDSRLLSEQRRRKILDLIEQKGQITVREIADKFSVSAVTARGDLDVICDEGKAVRSHGGAVRQMEANMRKHFPMWRAWLDGREPLVVDGSLNWRSDAGGTLAA